MRRALCRLTLFVASLAVAIAADGQTPGTAQPSPGTAASAGPCDPAAEPPAAVVAAFLDRILVPGRKFSLEGIPPETLQKLGDIQKQEALRQAKDWPNLCKYQSENTRYLRTGVRPKAVFFGDSITEFWKIADPDLFGQGYVDRGISGQTTPQILLRFYQDVVALHPQVVHIMAGTNDIGGNTGPASDAMILDNIRAMIDIAQAHGIRVVLASITPTKGMIGSSDERGRRTKAIDVPLRKIARDRNIVYADYYDLLDDGNGGMRNDLSNDGIHPNRAGYALMRPVAERAIAAAQGRR